MKQIRKILFAFALLAVCVANAAPRDANIVSASLRLEPESPYVGERFDVCLDIATDPGCEIEGLNLQGFPYEVEVRQQGNREQAKTADGREIEWHHLRGSACSTQAFSAELNCVIRAMLTRRVTHGPFNSVYSSSSGARLPPFNLVVREMPKEGAPDGYAGAIGGDFRVEASVEPANAAIGDLLTMTVRVHGTGWLNGASPILPSMGGSDLRVYPPQEIERTDSSVTLRQVVIPLSTNVTALGVASFPFFDSKAGAYRVAESEPLAIAVAEKSTVAEAPAVKTIQAPVVESRLDTTGEKAISNVVATASDIRKVMPWIVAVLLAIVIGGGIGCKRVWVRFVIAAAVFALALVTGIYMSSRGDIKSAALAEDVELRVAPSHSAKSLGWMPRDTEVRVVETYGAWTKVVGADGRRSGWIEKKFQ